MAGLEDLPNELLLELLYQCHPRAALALVTALPPVFRAFRWQRSNIIHLYQQRLSVVLMEAQCDSTDEFEERVRYNWRLAVSSAANLSHNYFIEDWPSDLPMLAVMADICSEVDFLVEKVRLKHWDAMLKRVNTLRSSSSYATVPRPEGFGPTESWLVQVGLLYYERYCPMHYHETRILPPDMEKTRFWPHTNFFTSIRFVCNIHWNILLDVLDNEPLRRIFPHTQQARDDAQEMIDDERCMRLISIFSKEKTQFLRYLCSFGIHFASVVSQSSPLERRNMILYKFSDFLELDGRYPRHYFPYPEPRPGCHRYQSHDLVVDPTWEQRISIHSVYNTRYEWVLGPWFDKWGTAAIPTQAKWWEYIRNWERRQTTVGLQGHLHGMFIPGPFGATSRITVSSYT